MSDSLSLDIAISFLVMSLPMVNFLGPVAAGSFFILFDLFVLALMAPPRQSICISMHRSNAAAAIHFRTPSQFQHTRQHESAARRHNIAQEAWCSLQRPFPKISKYGSPVAFVGHI